MSESVITEAIQYLLIILGVMTVVFYWIFRELKENNKQRRKTNMENMMFDRILSKEEVMEILDIGRSTYYELVNNGELKSFTIGGRVKVPMSSVQNFIKEKIEENNKR